MDDDQQFCLRWNNHQSTLISVFDTLLENETLVDCTLAAEGKFLKAHKVVLSACSPYFATLLQEQYDKHPIFILKDVKYQELRAMMDYMYRGEVNISQDQLAALLKAAESLQIKGLSDNRSSSGGGPKHDPPQQQQQQQQQLQHRGLGLPGIGGGLGLGGISGKHGAGSGYTLEQTKRARLGPASIDSQDHSGSREGSSSPTSRRRRKLRRRSIDNTMSDVHHENSNSSQIQSIATTSSLLQQQPNSGLGNVGAIAAAASALASHVPPSVAAVLPTTAVAAASNMAGISTAVQSAAAQQQMTVGVPAGPTTSATKKTENVKGSSGVGGSSTDVMHSELLASIEEQQQEQQQQSAGLVELKTEKQNHKQQKSVLGKDVSATTGSSVTSTELVIEPKSEYDEEGNEENVEDLTLDDEDMGMEDLDHNAGTSHGNEGSSQGYAQWQHDRSQDEVFMATQEAQQRDPQDLSNKLRKTATTAKLDLAQNQQIQLQRTQPLSILDAQKGSRSRNSLDAAIVATGKIANDQSTAGGNIDCNQPNLLASSAAGIINGNRKRLSANDVSDMLFELYKANAAKAPKNEQKTLSLNKPCQKSPTSAQTESSPIVAVATNFSAIDDSNDAASKNLQGDEVMSESNARAKEDSSILVRAESLHAPSNASFHPRIKYSNVSKPVATSPKPPVVKAIPTSVLVSNTQEIDVKPLIHPTTGQVIEPTSRPSVSTVIQSAPSSVTSGVMPQAAAIAAALLRDGYHNFQQQLRAQEILKLNRSSVVSPLPSSVLSNTPGLSGNGEDNDNGNSAGNSNGNCISNSNTINNTHVTPTKLLENFLRQQRSEQQQQQQQRQHRNSECNNEHNSSTDTNDGDDEDGDDSRYNGFDDIHLIEGCKTTGVTAAATITAFTTNSTGQINVFPTSAPTPSDYMSDESQKFMIAAQAQVLRNLEYSLSDYGGNSPGEGEPTYECRHCGKKYRWKSTLRRHENVECGGKEPSHQCPYCPYKSKQRGNLGVHVRKHHSNLPQLASKRRSKYSVKLESSVVRTDTTVVSAAATLSPMTLTGTGSANGSDDSSSKLVIDCSK